MKKLTNTTLRVIFSLILILGLVSAYSFNTFFTSPVNAQIPQFINYQGKLKDSGGVPLFGTYDFRMRIYDDLTAGNLLYAEEQAGVIVKTGGIFDVQVGTGVVLNPPNNSFSTLDFAVPYYLTVEVGQGGVWDGEMSPRVALAAYMYAFNASRLDGHSAGTGADDVLLLDSSGDINFSGDIITPGNIASGAITIAGMEDTAFLIVDDITNAVSMGIYAGDGTPEGVVAATMGSLFMDESGELYLKESGTGNTGWVNMATAADVLALELWQQNSNILSPFDSAIHQISISNHSDGTLTGFKAISTNDTHNYAGAVFEVKGSGADYTNNMYFGKYGASFWIPSWAGNGVMATDKDLVIGALGSASEMLFQVTGGYSSPNDVMTLNFDGLAFNTGVRINEFLDEDDFGSNSNMSLATQQSIKTYVDGAVAAGTPSAGNGLTLAAGVMKLGGNLSEHTYLDHQGYSFVVREFAGETETEFNGDNFKIVDSSINREVRYGIGGADFAGLSLEGVNQHNFYYRDSAVRIDSNLAAFAGLQYGADYSSNYVDRSLVDKAYVDSHVGTSLWDADGDTGMQVEASADEDIIRFDTAGSERMFIDATGKIAISKSPAANLVSVLQIGPGGHEASMFSVSGDRNYLNIANFRDADGESIFRASGTIADGDFLITFGDAEYADTGTYFGIDPSGGHFDVGRGEFRFLDTNRNNYVGFIAPGVLSASTIWTLPGADGSSGQVLSTDGAGNLGWSTGGSTSPWGSSGGRIYPAHGGDDVDLGSAETLTLGSVDQGQIMFSGTNRVVSGEDNLFWDDTNDRLGIGTNSPDYALQVNGTIAPEAADQDLGTSALRWDIYANGLDVDDTVTFSNSDIWFTGLGTGGVGNRLGFANLGSNLVIRSSSSKKYKHDIADLDVTMDQVQQLRAVRFKWNADTATPDLEDVGLIAEEVEEIFPILVVHDAEGNPDGVRYEMLSIMLLETVQQMQVEIDALGNPVLDVDSLEVAMQLSTGSLVVDGDAVVGGALVIYGDITAQEGLKILGHIKVGADTAGEVVIPAGMREVEVVFDQPYLSVPVVNVTAEDFFGRYSVSERSATGFKIKLSEAVTEEINFQWFAVEVE